MKVIQKLLWAGLMVLALSPADDGVALAIDSHRMVQQIDVSRLIRDLKQDPYLEHYAQDS